jgi:hypothetical protein
VISGFGFGLFIDDPFDFFIVLVDVILAFLLYILFLVSVQLDSLLSQLFHLLQ